MKLALSLFVALILCATFAFATTRADGPNLANDKEDSPASHPYCPVGPREAYAHCLEQAILRWIETSKEEDRQCEETSAYRAKYGIPKIHGTLFAAYVLIGNVALACVFFCL